MENSPFFQKRKKNPNFQNVPLDFVLRNNVEHYLEK